MWHVRRRALWLPEKVGVSRMNSRLSEPHSCLLGHLPGCHRRFMEGEPEGLFALQGSVGSPQACGVTGSGSVLVFVAISAALNLVDWVGRQIVLRGLLNTESPGNIPEAGTGLIFSVLLREISGHFCD